MNRTDRLLAIVLELQAKGNRRAIDLSETFETSVRTIYRDIESLSETGVPIVAIPGQGYSLPEGYFLPPLRFSPSEATMLLLGADFVAQNLDAEYREAAYAASRKIEAVMSPDLREEVRYLQSSIRFVASDPFDDAAQSSSLQQLRGAIIAHKCVRFRYQARKGEEKSRTVDPYGLAFVAGAWILVAFDHARNARRHFRLDRMSELSLLTKTFTRPAGFSFEEREESGRNILVQARFDRNVARWVREARNYYRTAETETPSGLVVTLMVRDETDALAWLLGWGKHVEVLEPESLRRRMIEEAKGILQNNA